MTLVQVILFICLSSAAFAFSDQDDSVLVGPAFCANGQVAWCHNFSTAADCNAVKHCLQTVWLTQKPPVVLGSCGSCETSIQDIRQSIGSNTTKEVMQELLENICSLNFVFELFRKRCERYVDQYVDSYFNELLDLLKSDIDPGTICHLLGFCSNLDSSSLAFEDDSVVRFRNIILHLPAEFVDIPTSNQLVGISKCTWGPSYWCHNLTSSAECRSTSHCINTVWSKADYPDDNDSVCKVCKDMVQQARDQLQSNETQEELREVFEGSCKLIPIKEVRNECIKLADEFVPELTEMLVSEMNPTVICTVAGLCNSAHIDDLLNAALKPADSCTNCTAAVTAVERYLLRAPQSQVLNKLLRLCGQLSSYSESCMNMVTANFDRIYETLITETRPFPVCHLSGMCTQRYHQHSTNYDSTLRANVDTMLATANDDLPCDLCKQLVKHLKDVLTTNTTEGEFLAMLQGICEHTKSFKDECLKIVNEDFLQFYKFLTEELNPEEVCQEVNLCPQKKNLVSDENLQLIGHGVPTILTELSVATPAGTECRICRMVIGLVQKEINKPEYEHDIEKVLEKVCSLAPRTEKDKCDQFIETYADTLIKLLADQTDPGIVCQLLGLCSAPALHNDLCPICQDVMHYVEEQLQNPEEQEKVEDVVRKICRVVPKSEQTECQSFINDYTALILSVLSTELDPSTVCPAIKLCPQKVSPFERCIQCQHLIGDVTATLGRNRSEANVVSALHSFVPVRHSDSFLTALQLKVNHADDLVEMMVADFDAQESCVYLHFCEPNLISSTDTLIEDENDLYETNDISPANAPTKPSCELCELMVQLYVDKLTSNSTEQEIEADLQKFCVKIKNPDFRSNCSHFVQKYVPQVVKLLKQDVKPEEVCSLVKLCTPKLHLESVVRNDRCEFCEAVVGSLEGLFADPHKMTQSMEYLLDICDVFQKPNERTNCRKIVSMVGPQLESVALGIPSWYYCSKMEMCPYGARLSYKRICSVPSQWCLDTTKAILCGRLSYCQKSVWMSDKPSL